MADNEKSVAERAVDEAIKVTAEAKEAVETAKALTEEVRVAFGNGEGSFKSMIPPLVQMAKDFKEGKSSVPRETIIEVVKEVHNAGELERKQRGLLVGGRAVSDEMAKAFDTHNKNFDYTTFLLRTGKLAITKETAFSVLDSAMLAQPMSELQRSFQHAHEDLMIFDAVARAQHAKHPHKYKGARVTFPQLANVCEYLRTALLAEMSGKAAVDPNDVGDTSDWMPTVFSPDFRSLMFLELAVESLFNVLPYTGKASVVRMPINITNSIGHLVPQNLAGGGQTYALANPFAAADPVQLGTPILDSKKDFTFQMHRGRSLWQGIIDEDTPVAFASIVRNNILLEIARASETAIINGQKSGEIDTGGGGVAALTYDPRNSWDGLRKAVRAQTGSSFAAGNAELTVTMLMKNAPILGGKYMVNPSVGAIILAPVNLFHIITDAAVWTAEKYGPQATVLTGSLASVGGKPIILSEHVPTNLNATGIYDAVTTDRTVALIVHRPSFIGMEHRAIDIGVDYWRASDVFDAVGMRRLDWGKLWGNSEKAVTEVTNLKTV